MWGMPWVLACACMLLFPSVLGADKKKEASCDPLPYASLRNGKITALSRQRFRFGCNLGYFLTGPHDIRCWNGNWTSTRQPVCQESEGRCHEPPKISNGEVHGDGQDDGSVIQYMCHQGYVLLGNGRRTCRSSYWTGTMPACLAESEPLQNIANRLEKQFVTKIGSFSNDSVISSRLLDSASMRKGLDLVIVLDRSSSVDPVDFEIGKRFIKFLFDEFGIKNGHNPGGTRAAVLAFGNTVDIVFNLNNESISNKQEASRVLDTVQPGGGGTAMVPALTMAYVRVEPRMGAKKALFLITDGEPNIGSPDITPEDIANQLKGVKDYEIFTVGIGKEVNRQLLTRIASEPPLSHVFILDKYSDLENIMMVIKDRPPEPPPVSPDRCGYIDKKKPRPKNWPWLAAIYITLPRSDVESEANETEPSTRLSLCAGALICSQWVLTSASCFFHTTNRSVYLNKREVFVVLGEDDLTAQDTDQTNFYAVDVIISEKSDLAVIKLNVPASNEKFRPVCLPPTARTVPLHLDLNLNTTIAGWGLPQETKTDNIGLNGGSASLGLVTATVALAEEGECARVIRKTTEDMFCAGSGPERTCVGDLGSPIIAEDPTTSFNHVLGILSQRSSCHKGYSQYVQLNTKHHIRWINRVTGRCHYRHWM